MYARDRSQLPLHTDLNIGCQMRALCVESNIFYAMDVCLERSGSENDVTAFNGKCARALSLECVCVFVCKWVGGCGWICVEKEESAESSEAIR